MRDPTPHFEALFEVLNFSTKRELERHCKNLIIYQQDLVALILATQHGALEPYRYANHFDRTTTSNLYPNDTERSAISKNGIGEFKTRGAKKFASKISQLFKEQRALAAHIFYSPNHRYWHLFYFDNRDTSEHGNHWKHGPHVHYVSDLWPELTLAEAWRQVTTGDFSFRNKLHIKYRSDYE